jgi:ubiquinone biosynthesis protein Coq4
MLQILDKYRIARAFGRLIDDPRRTEEIFLMSRLARRADDQRPMQVVIDSVAKIPEFVELFERRYLPKLPTMEQLSKCPPGSLGEAYYLHLKRNNLRPDFFPAEPTDKLLGYFILRSRQQHDLWHVLADYDTSIAEEMALQAFTLAQIDNTLSSMLLAGGLIHFSQQDPYQVKRVMELIVEGFERGRDIPFLLLTPWEERLDLPLGEARRLAGIPPRSTTFAKAKEQAERPRLPHNEPSAVRA